MTAEKLIYTFYLTNPIYTFYLTNPVERNTLLIVSLDCFVDCPVDKG